MDPNLVLIVIGIGVVALEGLVALVILLNRWTLSSQWQDSPSIAIEERSRWMRARIALRDNGWWPLVAVLIGLAVLLLPVVLGALGADGGPGAG